MNKLLRGVRKHKRKKETETQYSDAGPNHLRQKRICHAPTGKDLTVKYGNGWKDVWK